MKNKLTSSILLAMSALVMFSCSDDEPTINIDNPAVYEFLRNGNSTVSYDGQTTRLAMGTELITAMRDFEQDETVLLEMYANQTESGGDANPYEEESLNESTKSVKSKVAASFDYFSSNSVESSVIKDDIQSWIERQVQETFPSKNILATEGNAGQIADGSSVRYVSAKGLEYNQTVNKSLIGALILDQICNNYLSDGVLDADDNRVNNTDNVLEEGKQYTTMEHKWDEAYGYIFGASTNSTEPLLGLEDDIFLHKYLDRVEGDTDFAGISETVFQAFKLGRAAIVAGEYEVRDEQIEIIRENLSKVIAIRAIYYLQNGKNALANGDMGGAFHDLSEGYGFIYSLRFTRKSNSDDSYFTSTEVEGFIDLLEANNGFWTVSSETLDQISTEIAEKFDFTVEQAAN